MLAVILMIAANTLKSQTIANPNFGLKSHETLGIDKVEVTREKTVLHLTIENRIENGNFCADRRIYITDPAGNRLKVIRASGIPVCPDSYKFKQPGEKLSFTLTFPALTGELAYIDLREECSDNCFSFYGIVLDEYINSRLDEAFSMAERGESLKAMDRFINISETAAKNNGIRALIYFNIIKLATETGNTVKAGDCYKKLGSMSSRGGKIYIDQLNLQGIIY
ncbi:MAG TPA: hypothetical protein VMV47_01040 [Bacteroidales bacterium]|nr:hypothetical protein [Bacteroidales bacterium]